MKKMTSAEVREAFLEFFEEMNHKRVASSSLVPGNDPTLLFTNAGMVQFKDVFLGLDQRPYSRATSSQKCMRVSGKHNDLENVGPSNRHHTFFEMLGNFSFGDYFKSGAIQLAWDLLTKVYELPPDRLAVTIYEKDDESYDIWVNEIGISPQRIARLGPDDNFWQMAETGPCGPNSEIHWDRHPERGEDDIIPSLEADDGRFMEIWNLVFMQYNRTQDDPEHTGQYDEPLPATGVDTGMGFERMVTVMQGVEANYETDLFMPIIERVQELTGHTDAERDADIVPYRVIADHMRAASFLIADGVRPGATGRDYVCRMVIRRAVRFGTKLGFEEPFLANVTDAVVDKMGEAYPEVLDNREGIRRTVTNEEVRFRRAMDRALAELGDMLADLPESGTLAGEDAFRLHAEKGLPLEITRDIVQERGFSVDEEGFRAAQSHHEAVSRGVDGGAFSDIDMGQVYLQVLNTLKQQGLITDRVQQDQYGPLSREARVLAILRDGELVDSAQVGDRVEVVLDSTPFYVEAGGQVSDTGVIEHPNWTIDIEDARQPVGGLIVHIGEVVEGQPATGADCTISVDGNRRLDIMRNHTATHLLHAQLRAVLGTHVQQRGSLVAPDRLRFDFSHDEAVRAEELDAITHNVNEAILADLPVTIEWKDLDTARSEGAMALFGEKYAEDVRTVNIWDNGDVRYSYELCGGNHVEHTGIIGPFVITAEGSVAQGIRRVEALTGHAAEAYIRRGLSRLNHAAWQLGTTPDALGERIAALQEDVKFEQHENARLRR
ncbi:MAG: alanine--tRNA ligase, partial [Chloroflexi bacterium]|nr:alanine--tRNA ligase [Chloroflexota bacterium]